MTIRHNDTMDDRPSGVPRRGELGESKKELWALLLAIVVIAVIIIAFWLEATP
jgi:hypothetical protein